LQNVKSTFTFSNGFTLNGLCGHDILPPLQVKNCLPYGYQRSISQMTMDFSLEQSLQTKISFMPSNLNYQFQQCLLDLNSILERKKKTKSNK
jgi:hypothetical protein